MPRNKRANHSQELHQTAPKYVLMLCSGGVVQVAQCMNAVRTNPDAFACYYPCDYSKWRDDIIDIARGPLTIKGTDGVAALTW